ncbi:protein transport protein S31 [Coemansia sp. RSA 990]|nr:protein transport protein S31 [Coemansia sp. RSA 1086]KAJ1747946.1 protein transport protein S31 [Coemansia sp. RSA 1821]KAJ1869975.1 protein transport protein S31 [Coemansia sp. RSA 990]
MGYHFIERTAVPAWSPRQGDPLVATGTVAGAMDASFSNTSTLEIFKLPEDDSVPSLTPLNKVEAPARFQRLAWSKHDTYAQGVLAGGLENGDVTFWDPQEIIDGNASSSVLHSSSAHTGAVCGLEFNPLQPNLMASGATNGEVFIWDIVNEFKSHSSGARSQRIENVTDLAWNNQVQHILVTASNTGALVVWDLRQHREIMVLNSSGNVIGASQTRAGASAVVWNPASATQLVSASSDDNSSDILFWDLRNANAPARTLSGHQRGVLSLSWCRKDAGLLLSSGKDNRTICWDPSTSEIVGELPPAANWVYDVQWNQSNPNLLSGASFDGRVSLYTLSRQDAAAEAASRVVDDPFAPQSTSAFAPSLSLKRPPKWLARPCGASFGFGGRLVRFTKDNTNVSIVEFVSEPELARQAQQLESLLQSNEQAADLCRERLEQSRGTDQERSWQVLQILFESDARDKLIRFMGFDKAAVQQRIQELIQAKQAQEPKTESVKSESAKSESVEQSNGDVVDESMAGAEDKQPDKDAENEKTDEDAGNDLFSGTVPLDAEAEDFFSKPMDSAAPESTAATVGTGGSIAPSVVAGADADIQALQVAFSGAFQIYDKRKDVAMEDADGLVTRAVLLGDIASAVSLCIEQERFADALVLATCSPDPALATRAQQAYFARRAQQASYVRLLHSIATGDLTDVVENADISEWDEALALLCTYAQGDQFSNLCEVLGRRLEAASEPDNAVLCYLASGNLDKVACLWIASSNDSSQHSHSRIQTIHSLVEKVSVFRNAVQFIDPALDDEATTFPLAPLYDVYIEYAQFLTSQGLTDTAQQYLMRVPKMYRRYMPNGEDALATLRNLLGMAAETPWSPAPVQAEGFSQQQQPQQQQPQPQPQQQPQQQLQQQPYGGYPSGYPATSMPAAQHYTSHGNAMYPASSAYASAAPAYPPMSSGFAGMAQGYPSQPAAAPSGMFPPPPQPLNPASIPSGQTPPPRRDDGAWNDPPMVSKPVKRASQAQAGAHAKPAAIVSPFPQGRDTPPPASVAPYAGARSPLQQQAPPPPRAGFVPATSKPMPPPPSQQQAASMAFPTAQHAPAQPHAQPFQPSFPPPAASFSQQQPGFMPPASAAMAAAPVMSAPQSMRGQVVAASAAGPRSSTPGAPAPPPAQASTPKPSAGSQKYPPGDRSHLPAEWKPVFSALSGALDQAKQFAAPGQKRMVTDADRRLNQLFDLMNCDEIKMKDRLKPVFDQLVSNINARQYPAALQCQAELMTINSDIMSCLVGVKHLINVLKTLPM